MNGKVFASMGVGNRGDLGFNLGGGNFPVNLGAAPNPFGNPVKRANWDQLQIGMTEQQVIDLFGQPAQNHTFEDVHVIHANVTQDEVRGPDGKTKPVKKFTYFRDIGEVDSADVTLVDGKVFKIKK